MRREYDLIRESVAQAGFNLVDGRDIDWGENLANTSLYDAALFGWQTTAIAVADSIPNYVEGGLNNFYGYNNPTVNELGAELNSTSDPARQDEILIEIEQNLFADAFGLPIFQHPVDHGLQQHLRRWREQHRHRPDGVLQRVGLDGGLLSRRAVTVSVTCS